MIKVEFYEKNRYGTTTIKKDVLPAIPRKGERLNGFFQKSGTWVVKEIHWYFGSLSHDEDNQVLIRCRRPHFWEFIW